MTTPFVPRYKDHPWKKKMNGVRKCDECSRPAAFGSPKCVQHGGSNASNPMPDAVFYHKRGRQEDQ